MVLEEQTKVRPHGGNLVAAVTEKDFKRLLKRHVSVELRIDYAFDMFYQTVAERPFLNMSRHILVNHVMDVVRGAH